MEPVINTSYHLTSLTPFTFYYVEVVAENGVSNQSSNQERKVSVVFTTNPGSKTRIISSTFVECSMDERLFHRLFNTKDLK